MSDSDLFFIWQEDDIDSSFFGDTDEPRPLYVCLLCIDTEDDPDVIRGYDPRDGIFERPGRVVESLGGIDAEAGDEYRRKIEQELLAEFESRRESMIQRRKIEQELLAEFESRRESMIQRGDT